MFGSHIASNGGNVLFSETTLRTWKENTNRNAKAIPKARFSPSPPRFFCEDKDNPKKVKIIIENGIDVLWYSSL